ncbi:hypothetical protein ACLOJK_030417 [Asimina triloba]
MRITSVGIASLVDNHIGLEEFSTDKSKCQEHFDVYKECKKKEDGWEDRGRRRKIFLCEGQLRLETEEVMKEGRLEVKNIDVEGLMENACLCTADLPKELAQSNVSICLLYVWVFISETAALSIASHHG